MSSCIICKFSEKDDIQYGEFLENKKFGVHTFCLYLSSNLAQRGNDDQGFLGFLEKDIRQEVKRISRLKCCYCKQNYANIGCCEPKCYRTFHLICGIEHKAENRFCHDYRSFCHRHTRKVKERPSANETCLICFESICAPGEKFNKMDMILTPCCRNGWFHKLCLQRFAKTAGYFFKCPLCNDDRVFREKLLAKGIFIPNQDAAWELEPNAFAELLERPNKCAAERCKNRKGRKAKSDTNPFIMCHACGSVAIHKLCLPNDGKQFNCADCSIAKEDPDSGRESLNSHANHNEDEYVDVCHVSDKEDLEIINRLTANSSKMIENKRDSGTKMDADSSDEEIPQVSINCRKFAKSNKVLDSETGSDMEIKPTAVKKITRIPLDSECSETQAEISNKDRKSNQDFQLGDNLMNERKEENFMASNSGSNCNSQLENSITTNLDSIKYINQLESEEEHIKSCEKRKSLVIESDSDDDEFFSPTKKRFKNINTEKENAHNDSCILVDESSDDSDSDPVEYFFQMIKKKNDAQASKKDEHLNERKELDATNCRNQAKNKTSGRNKNRKFAKLKAENNLNISCIAKRTRRRTICSERSSNVTNINENAENNISCIALRTRRKTICGRTDYSKNTDNEMSPVYEYEDTEWESCSNTNTDVENESSEEESSSDTNSKDTDNFIVEDSYDEKDSKFEISCIANRTRKRKCIKQLRLSRIVEVSDCPSESSNATDLIYNRKKLRKRINFNSSEDFQPTPPRLSKNTASSNLEKFPLQDFTPVLNTTNKNSCNYFPLHSYHPHSSNRNRF